MTRHRTNARPRVAFQGEPGAFSEEALAVFFDGDGDPLPRRDFRAVVDAVEGGEATFGILPVENTLAGGVGGAWDALADSRLEVVGEIIHPIRLFLLGMAGARVAELERILSHPVALAQCTRFLSAHAHAQAVAVHDTAGAAQEVAREGNPRMAAVAPQGAADRYGLAVLQPDLQDRADNQTRFFVVRREGGPQPPAGSPAAGFSTVLLVEARDQPGALLRLLVPFATRGIDLSRIESRPGAQPWQYRFVMELRADASERRTREALDELRSLTAYFRLLGSFPGAERARSALR
jgi:prephenate dehydratase/chorismate mutase/prephenate dehydratase